MTGRSNFGVLLELLADEGALEEPLYGGGNGSARAQRREVARQVHESTEAQLTLFRLAWELTADAADLVEFAATIRERFGVDLIGDEHTSRRLIPLL